MSNLVKGAYSQVSVERIAALAAICCCSRMEGLMDSAKDFTVKEMDMKEGRDAASHRFRRKF